MNTLLILPIAAVLLVAAAEPGPLDLVPPGLRPSVARALAEAGGNRDQLVAAIRTARPEHRAAVAFLVAHMPQRDLTSLSRDYIVGNIELAFDARERVPWGKAIPDELFLNDVLPYASVNERRDDWRRDFHARFLPVVQGCTTPGEAACRLNATVFKALGVQYHATRRPKPDQSPHESTEAGYASCTGLSILLIDACRAVCVPARFVGTPLWANRKGNHSWVEVWDRQWRFVGAAEPGPLDRTWFVANARQADPTKAEHRIYAASFARSDLWFPLVWERTIRYVRAVDVTRFYTTRRRVRFEVVDKRGRRRVRAGLTLRLGGRIVAQGVVDGTAEFVLAGGQTYEAEIRPPGGAAVRRQVAVTEAEGQSVVLPVK